MNYFVTYANLAGFDPAAKRSEPTMLDQWMLSQQAGVNQKVTTLLDEYDFMRAGRLLEEYIGDLSTWYLRRSRKRDDTAFFGVMYDVLSNLTIMLAPFVPFLAEKVYQTLKQEGMPESVHLCGWPELDGVNAELDSDMARVRQAVELGLSVRAGEKIKVRQPLAAAYVQADPALPTDLLEILADELNVLNVEQVKEVDDGLPMRRNENLVVALDIVMTDELQTAGWARELLRHIQQLRKQGGLQPGQLAVLVVDPSSRPVVEPLLSKRLEVDAYLSDIVYEPLEGDPLADLNGLLLIAIRA